MANPEYYRRQSELCLQLALLYDDQHMTLWLVDLAKKMQAKADNAETDRSETDRSESEPPGMPGFMMGSEGSPDDGRDQD